MMQPAAGEPRRVQDHHLRAWYVLGDLYDRAGDPTSAATYFRRILRRDPASPTCPNASPTSEAEPARIRGLPISVSHPVRYRGRRFPRSCTCFPRVSDRRRHTGERRRDEHRRVAGRRESPGARCGSWPTGRRWSLLEVDRPETASGRLDRAGGVAGRRDRAATGGREPRSWSPGRCAGASSGPEGATQSRTEVVADAVVPARAPGQGPPGRRRRRWRRAPADAAESP